MKKIILCMILVFLTIGCAACKIDKGVGGNQGSKASTNQADLTEYYNLSEYSYLTVINGVISEERSVKAEGEVYLPYGIVKKLDSRFYLNFLILNLFDFL